MLDAAHGKSKGAGPGVRPDGVDFVAVEPHVARAEVVGSVRRRGKVEAARADFSQGSRRTIAVARSRSFGQSLG